MKKEKRDRSLEIKFVGTKEYIEKMTAEVKRIVLEIAPKATLSIYN
jgi:hypothetical protein